MADRYWVGGAGTWDATTTTNWAASSGGAGGASAPTETDNVIFDTLSNATLYTVTVGTNAVSNDLTVAAPLTGAVTFSLGATAVIDCYGSMTLPAANCTLTGVGGAYVNFRATTTGKTFTTNGVNFGNVRVNFEGAGGEWTLGSAFTNSLNATTTFFVTQGTLITNNFNITTPGLRSEGSLTRTITLGSSTVTTNSTNGGVIFSGTNLTFNAGTSQITLLSAASALTGNGQTFYNVSLTSAAAGTVTINGANTFNNLSITSRSATGTKIVSISANQTVSGTLTLGAANTSIRRVQVQSDTIGTQRTITLNGSLATLADCDFRDIATAGTVGTWTGTRIGNGLGNSGITFDADKDVYWNLAAGGNWSATGWALSSGGGVDANNFPLAQDKVIIENTGLNTSATITLDIAWWIGELDLSTRSNAMTLANAANAPFIYKNVTLSSAVTMTGTGAWSFVGQGTTQILDVNTATFTPPITINSPTGTLQLAENATCSSTVTLTSGSLDLSSGNRTLSCTIFSSSNSNTRAIAFGTGKITTTGSGTVWTTATATNFSRTGTPTVDISNNSATATTVSTGTMTEAQSLNFNYTTGTYTLTDTAARYKSVNFTGFSGTIPNSARTIFGGLTLSAGMTLTAGSNATTFAATSGTQQITTAAKTMDFPLTFDGIGGTFAFQDALTQGSTRAFTITNGTIQLKDGATSTVGSFATSGTTQKFLESTLAGTQATLSQASGTVNASYLTIQDINATGGATWNAFTTSNNVDAGNNSGWDFSTQLGRYIYTRRKNKRILP